MDRPRWAIVAVAAILLSVCGNPAFAQRKIRNIPDDPLALGKPLSYWVQVIRARNEREISEAYDAIVLLGPEASRAVPELTRIVEEPFTPIDLSRDTRSELNGKLKSILLKAGAVDSLGAIGEGAATATEAVLEWSLTVRVVPADAMKNNSTPDPLFIELVTIDVLERMRGAGSVARFGPAAAGPVQELVESGDPEKRKLAIAILNEGALPIAKDLLTSPSCRDRVLGLSVLTDLWPVVAEEHLRTLKSILECSLSATMEGSAAGIPRTPGRRLSAR